MVSGKTQSALKSRFTIDFDLVLGYLCNVNKSLINSRLEILNEVKFNLIQY